MKNHRFWSALLVPTVMMSCGKVNHTSVIKDAGVDNNHDVTSNVIGGVTDLGMTFVRIPKGTFLMGSETTEKGHEYDEILHRVTITKDFLIQTKDVTQEQWVKVIGINPSNFKSDKDCPGQFKQVNGTPMCPNNPIDRVSWDDVQEFIQKLNDKHDGSRYRLPTEAEWEYAARGGTSGPYSVAGDISDFAWYVGNSDGRTHPVGLLKPNSFGLYDIHGNVWQWTNDYYGEYQITDVIDPQGASWHAYRLLRGGAWGMGAFGCRSAYRGRGSPSHRFSYVGFRLVMVVS